MGGSRPPLPPLSAIVLPTWQYPVKSPYSATNYTKKEASYMQKENFSIIYMVMKAMGGKSMKTVQKKFENMT